MLSQISENMHAFIVEYFADTAMEPLLAASVREKAEQPSIWGEITLNTHYMFGGRSPQIARLAACTELILLALDIIDDVQDQDNTTSVWRTYPDALAMNAAVALLQAVMRDVLLQEGQYSKQLYDQVNECLLQAFDGQHLDVMNAIQSETAYMDMVQQKSGSLVQLACRMGYACMQLDEEQRADLGKLGDVAALAGIVAQLDNDVRDLLRYDRKNDLLHKKKTLPILYLLSHDHPYPAVRAYYSGDMEQHEFLQQKQACLTYIRESGCIEYTIIIQKLCMEKARQQFDAITALTPWKEQLGKLLLITDLER